MGKLCRCSWRIRCWYAILVRHCETVMDKHWFQMILAVFCCHVGKIMISSFSGGTLLFPTNMVATSLHLRWFFIHTPATKCIIFQDELEFVPGCYFIFMYVYISNMLIIIRIQSKMFQLLTTRSTNKQRLDFIMPRAYKKYRLVRTAFCQCLDVYCW